MENNTETSQKTKKWTAIWASDSTPWYMYEKKQNTTPLWKDKSTSVFIAALFTTAKVWKQPKCPTTNEWIKETWDTHTHTHTRTRTRTHTCTHTRVCTHMHAHKHAHTCARTHTMEYYSVIKKSKILTFAATWTYLEDMLSEMSQTDKYCISYICGNLKIQQTHEWNKN